MTDIPQEREALPSALGRLGLGTFPFSGVFSEVTQDGAASVVRAHVEGGGRYVETAPSYPVRNVDIGRILAAFPRDALLIGTKCVTGTRPSGEKVRSGATATIVTQCHDELGRLGVDYLDVLQAHITPEDVDPAETMRALIALKAEGLVRWVGVSNVTLDQLQAFHTGGQIDLVQNRMSLVHDGSHSELSSFCAAHDIYFNQYQVIERGLLTTSTTLPEDRREGDLRSSKGEYGGETFHIVRQWFEREVAPIAARAHASAEAIAINWVLAQPRVATCVVGATNAAQASANLAAARELPLGTLDAVGEARRKLAEHLRSVYGLTIEEFRGLA